MKTNLTILLVCFLNSACATNYYFSSISGDDTRTSTQAKSPSTPWKSLSKLNSFFASVQPGDSILLKRGETFFGSIIVLKSGTASLPIVIGAYGSGNRPIITSLVTLTNWVSKSNGIWESYNSSLGSVVNMVLLNGVEQEMGRYPNSNATNGGYLNFESHVGKTSITDNELTSAINWTGAKLVMRTRRWILDRNPITSHSGSTLSYTTSSIYEPYNNYGYFIQNSLKTLDKFGEWYYNPSTKKLSVYFGTNTPSSYTTSAATITDLIYSEKFSYVVFDNLTIKGGNSTGINIKSGTNLYIKNCDILFSGEDAVVVNYHTNFKIENCTIANQNSNGIYAGSGTDAIIRGNKILNTSVLSGMGVNGDGKGIAIYTMGDGNTIENNEIHNSGFIGINFKGNNVTIKNNLIDSFCLTKDDGSGLYCYTNFVVFNGIKVIGNIVTNGIGALPGTSNSIYSTSAAYIDNNLSNIEFTGNTLANCHDFGIYLHNSSGIVMKNNTLFNNSRQQLNMLQESDHPASMRNNIINQNILFSKLPTQLISWIKSSADDIADFGKFDSNYYARPLDDRITIYNYYPGVTANLDLDAWKKEYNKDAASKKTAKQIASYKLNSLIGANKITNGTFISNITGTSASSCTLSLILGLLDGGCLQVTPTAAKSYASMKVGGLTSGKKYILKYSVRGSVDNNMSVTTYLRQSPSPWADLTDRQTRKVSTTRSDYEIMFLALGNESSASVVFLGDQQSKYYLDNIQVYEANAVITNPDDSIKFVYNATKLNKAVTLDGAYIDTKGNKFSNSITLLPYASAILIKTRGTTNTAPTVSITSPSTNSNYTAPATIKLSADAADGDGTISTVSFYNGSTLLHTEDTAPYGYSWRNVPAGNYTITAKATDNSGNTTTSAGVLVSVASTSTAPTVGITSPTANANYTAPATIYMSAVATDANGTISTVEFYSGTTLLHTEHTAPYEYTWANVPLGNYTITAKAIDNGGNTTTSASVLVSVVSASTAPTASITSPTANASYTAPASIYMSAVAADANGTISTVQFYSGTTLLHTENTAPYEYTWTNMPLGNYTLTAKATDNSGNTTTSTGVPISVTSALARSTISAADTTTKAATTSTINTRRNLAYTVSKRNFSNGPISLEVSPNPVSGKLNIFTYGLLPNKKLTISVFSISGVLIKTIQSNTANQMIQLDVSSFHNGVYIVRALCEDRVLSKQFVKL